MVQFNFSLQERVVQPVQDFVKQSERVLNVTHKPRDAEFRQIAYVTALGMLLIGLIGFVISMVSHFLRGGG